MKHFLLLIFLSLSTMAQSQANDSSCTGEDISLGQFQWENRIIVMFDEDSDSDHYGRQMINFSSLEEELLDRDLILISVFDNECATLNGEIISDSSANDIRSRLSPQNKHYSIFLIGKDGGVKLKQDEVLSPDDLFLIIDLMPMRQREMRENGYRN